MTDVVQWVGFAAGLLIVIWTGQSVVRSLIVPRGLSSSLAAFVEKLQRSLFLFLSNRFETYEGKDRVLALQAPYFLLSLLLAWILLFYVGYSFMLWPFVESFPQALLETGSSMFTLGFANTRGVGTTILHLVAAATGLIVVALQIAYLPTVYGAFNRRETLVTLLQSRAGAPAWGPEILSRHHSAGLLDRLGDLYSDWERWAADVAETHTNYPVLIFFRSPHPLRSWVLGLLAVMDSAALCLALAPTLAPTQARLCLRMGFLCFRNVAQFLRIPYEPDPLPDDPVELTFEDFVGAVHRLDGIGFPMERTPEEAWPHFKGWRVNYEAIAYALSDLVVAPPGPWSGERSHLPGMAILPQRPLDRTPEKPLHERARGATSGH